MTDTQTATTPVGEMPRPVPEHLNVGQLVAAHNANIDKQNMRVDEAAKDAADRKRIVREMVKFTATHLTEFCKTNNEQAHARAALREMWLTTTKDS